MYLFANKEIQSKNYEPLVFIDMNQSTCNNTHNNNKWCGQAGTQEELNIKLLNAKEKDRNRETIHKINK